MAKKNGSKQFEPFLGLKTAQKRELKEPFFF